jgi:SAM-dependent methyltransferase
MKVAHNYGRLCAAFYDAEKPRPPAKDLRVYRELLSEADGRILEPMCGSGRFLLPLLDKKFDVVGFDNSKPMIAQCRARLVAKKLSANRAVLADFSTFRSKEKFDQSVITSGSFGLLDEKTAREALRAHRKWLVPNGLLHLEIWPIDANDANVRERSARVAAIDERRCIGLVVELVTHESGALHETLCHYTDIVDGRVRKTETERYWIRHYDLNEFRKLAESCNLRWVAMRENAFGDSRAIVTLRNPA